LEVLRVAFVISRFPTGEKIGISTMRGEYFLTKWVALWRKCV